MTKKIKILNFINSIRNSHSKMEVIFCYGSCMNFFVILKNVFPEAEAYCDWGHVITKIDDGFYDITGKVSGEGFVPLLDKYGKKEGVRVYKQMMRNEMELFEGDWTKAVYTEEEVKKYSITLKK